MTELERQVKYLLPKIEPATFIAVSAHLLLPPTQLLLLLLGLPDMVLDIIMSVFLSAEITHDHLVPLL